MNWLDEFKKDQERTFKSLKEGKCGCHHCIDERGEKAYHMVVCKFCGNKRCPTATDHKLTCTGSNEAGQVGSIYAHL